MEGNQDSTKTNLRTVVQSLNMATNIEHDNSLSLNDVFMLDVLIVCHLPPTQLRELLFFLTNKCVQHNNTYDIVTDPPTNQNKRLDGSTLMMRNVQCGFSESMFRTKPKHRN